VTIAIRLLAPPSPREASRYLATHGRSFWFASALMPEPHRSRVVAVYAYCRYTDDLVDRSGADRAELRRLLDRWLDRSRRAYAGEPTNIPLLRDVMRDMAESRVPFGYVEELIAGMRMDVEGQRYDSLEELRRYCHRVASTVGLWLTELFGVHDPWVLERAARLGTAMQLTNIIRDVGEDWRAGRLYVPRDRMARYGVRASMFDALIDGDAPIPPGYAALMRELCAVADADYRLAAEGIPMLPPFFRPAVAVAARVYAAIHEAVRDNGYDTLRRRAVTSMVRKVALAREALAELGESSASLDAAVAAARE
jgi:phytoene synthase